MGNDDKLGFLTQVVQIIGKPLHVPVVQGRIDLVQDAKRCRTDLQNGKVQCRCHEGFLAAGEQSNGLHLLSGRLNPDLNATGQGILRILQQQLALAAAEHFLKDLAEIVVDLLEFGNENGGHLFGNIPDNALQLPLGVEHIVPLGSQVGIALVDPGILLDGT